MNCKSCPKDFFTAAQLRGTYIFDFTSLNNNIKNEIRKKLSRKFQKEVQFIFFSQWSKEFCDENTRTLLRVPKDYEILYENYGKNQSLEILFPHLKTQLDKLDFLSIVEAKRLIISAKCESLLINLMAIGYDAQDSPSSILGFHMFLKNMYENRNISTLVYYSENQKQAIRFDKLHGMKHQRKRNGFSKENCLKIEKTTFYELVSTCFIGTTVPTDAASLAFLNLENIRSRSNKYFYFDASQVRKRFYQAEKIMQFYRILSVEAVDSRSFIKRTVLNICKSKRSPATGVSLGGIKCGSFYPAVGARDWNYYAQVSVLGETLTAGSLDRQDNTHRQLYC